ncbi:pyridoxal-phosphate dependent enzyme [Solirubrobacter soli]|uniref:pyridoxal-phosphate dependent enzyme n=1 Tax=Solirubrobacter soli TaxID=363832 RepID=UPI00040C34B4|nr:pyridoxal-phosphate dependent enzyme [Solirubrobacter soli]
MLLPISPDDVAAAARRLEDVANRTPVLTSRALDERLAATVFMKAESFQRGGSFKFRGAYNKVASLSERERARGVVASSSGNHAQALAIAASLAGTRATIFMPQDAPASKRAATEGYGARVIEWDRYADDIETIVEEFAEREGLAMVHPYDDPLIMAGAGTSTRELLEEAGPLDLVVVPAGGGGQIAGGAVAAAPTRVIGVEPAAVGQWAAAIAAGRPAPIDVQRTIADGQQVRAPGHLTFAVTKALVEDVVGVSDPQLLDAMRYLFERQKLVVEPSGASALAAILAGLIDVRGLRVGVILSGGNIAIDRFLQLMS